MNHRQATATHEVIARGEACPSCHADWDRPAPPQAWTLTHRPDCDYRKFILAQDAKEVI